MLLAPYGTFALLAGLIVDFSGDLALFKALGWYVLCVAGALATLIVVFYPLLIVIFKSLSLPKFFKYTLPEFSLL